MAQTLPQPARPRRTQAERSASTRGRLLDATIACLVEAGHAGATTAEIETRAGVSRGARLHHFPNKAALVSAAVEHVYAEVSAAYVRAMEELGPEGDRLAAGLRLLWDVYQRPSQAAVLELMMAARTDSELRRSLASVIARQHRASRRLANDLFPDLATREADGLFEIIQTTLLGLSLRRSVFGDAPGDDRVLRLLEAMVTDRFASPNARPAKEKRRR